MSVPPVQAEGNDAVYIKHRLIELAYQNMPVALVSTAIVVSLMFGFLFYSAPPEMLLPWAAGFVAVLAMRMFSLLWFNRAKQAQRGDSRRLYSVARWLYFTGVVLTGCMWSAMVIWLMPELDVNGSILLFVIVLGMSSGAIPSMGYQKLAIMVFITQLIGSLMWMTYALSVPNMLGVLITFVVYLVFLFRTAASFHESVKKMLVLQQQAIFHEKEILRQREVAQQANNAKTEFLSRVSHELRTPLNAVIGFTDLMQHDNVEPLTKKQRERTGRIRQASEHLLKLVNDVLDLSRIETGDLQMEICSVACAVQIKHVLQLVESAMKRRNITLQLELDESAPPVKADVVRLRQVLLNLFDNAIKYNRAGGRITVRYQQVQDTYCRVSVEDTGNGLSAEEIKKLFLPFSRPAASYSRVEGTGIGLSYSKQLVEWMQGRMGVDSQQPQGSCFWFELPIARKEDGLPAVVTVEKATSLQLVTALDGDLQSELPSEAMSHVSHTRYLQSNELAKRVLLVEDNHVNQEVAVDMISQLGFAVDVANNGVEAVDAFHRFDYTIILMDCEMPIMDGLMATRKIRQIERMQERKRVPIVALTAHAISGAREKCLASGMDDFLSKPFSYQEITAIVEKWTDMPVGALLQESRASDTPQLTDSMVVDAEEVIDMGVIERLQRSQQGKQVSAAKASLLSRVIGLYLQQTPAYLQQMQQAMQANELERLADVAHSVKSSSAAIGAMSLSELCRLIESEIKQGTAQVTEIKQKVSEIHHIYQRVA